MARRFDRLLSATVIATIALVLGATAGPAAAESTGTIKGVAFDDSDRDGLRDAGEPAFAGHSVYLLTAGATSFVAQATTDSDGRYSFEGLAPATYRVAYNSSTWNSMRQDWFPTTAELASPPWVELAVDGDASFDWGFRRIVRSTDVRQPISELVGPSGVRVQSYVDVVPAQAVHDALATGLLGAEAPHVTVRFGLGSTSTTSSSFVEMNGEYVSFSSVANVTYLSWAAGGGSWDTLAHEYGHAWSEYHLAMTQHSGTWDGYLEARGLAGDPRIGSSYAWMPGEMIAEDYRQLLGPVAARAGAQVNRDIPPAPSVPGLAEYLETLFTTPAGGTAVDTTAPAAEVVSPTTGATVAGTAAVVAAATDDTSAPAAVEVTVVVDGTLRVPATFDPADGRFHAPVDTTRLANGDHTVVAEATDAAGNTAVSEPVTATVLNAAKKRGGTKGGGRR